MKGGSGTLSYKKVSLVFIVFMMSMFAIHNVSASQRFADVPSSNGAYEEINYLVDRGVIKGYEENGKTVFKPNNQVTRGQAAKMVIEATGNKPLTVTNSSFTDIKLDLYPELSGYVESAVKLGFFTAYRKGEFAPNTPLTRNEMAKTLSTAFNLDVDKYGKLSLPFTDISKDDPYYKYIAAIYYNGITKGNETGTQFNPTKAVTRAQFASFIARSSEEKYRLDLPVQGVNVPNESEKIGTAISTTDNLNVRSSANSSISTNILGQVNTGDALPLYEVLEGGWLKVEYQGRYAYIYGDYAKIYDLNAQPDKEEPEKQPDPQPSEPATPPVVTQPSGDTTAKTIGVATVDDLHIRSEASGSSKSLGTINRGTKVTVHSVTKSWAKITYNNINGYISKKYLRLMNQSGSAVANRIIVLDPGHGGKDPGTSKSGAVEKAIVLQVAKKVQQKLEDAGATVYMTRSGDTYPTLQDRVDFAANKYAEVFVSIHVNSASSASASGTETYYSISSNANEKEDYRLASAINSEIVSNADMVNRGVKREDYYVLRNMLIPSVLIELGFVTNASDRAKLVDSEYVEIFADSIYQGIVQYYSN